jgi:signal transduction histidine kinase
LKENIWDKTEFVYVLAERFGAVLIFDYDEAEMEDFAQVYTMYNSNNLLESLDIINSNSFINVRGYYEKFRPDRRDNYLLNNSVRKIIESLNETTQEVLISKKEKETTIDNADSAARLEFLLTKSNFIAHEMRNLLSISNLYSNIIDKQMDRIGIEDSEEKNSIKNARNCINKSLMMIGNLLLDFKSLKRSDLKEHDLKSLVEMALELAKVYANGKDVNFKCEIAQTTDILADEDKFLAVLINLVKNAIENFESKGEIVIKTEITEENVKIKVSNNGKPIDKKVQEKICEEGFTTKATGMGLGLAICKENLAAQFAQLNLVKSDEVSTEFEVTVLRSER